MTLRHLVRGIAIVLTCIAAGRVTAWLASAQSLRTQAYECGNWITSVNRARTATRRNGM